MKRCQNFLQLLLPETSSTVFHFLQIPRRDSAAHFSNVSIALTYLTNHSPYRSLLICELWFSMPGLIPRNNFVPCYDLNVRMLFTFYKLQTEIISYWAIFPFRVPFCSCSAIRHRNWLASFCVWDLALSTRRSSYYLMPLISLVSMNRQKDRNKIQQLHQF